MSEMRFVFLCVEPAEKVKASEADTARLNRTYSHMCFNKVTYSTWHASMQL